MIFHKTNYDSGANTERIPDDLMKPYLRIPCFVGVIGIGGGAEHKRRADEHQAAKREQLKFVQPAAAFVDGGINHFNFLPMPAWISWLFLSSKFLRKYHAQSARKRCRRSREIGPAP